MQQRIEYLHRIEKPSVEAGSKPTPDADDRAEIFSVMWAHSGIGLIAVMGQLLASVGQVVSRCPHCHKVFLQSRRNQDHCGRSCQSVAYTQRRRAVAKAQTQKKAKGKKTGSTTSKKGRSRHGKKKG